MAEKNNIKPCCAVCDTLLAYSWTDMHGVGQCFRCGAPHRIWHYDENNKRIEKPPECILTNEWLDRCKQYWKETNHRMPSGCSFPGGQELASNEDIQVWNKFCRQFKEQDNG